jgi:hypothetical protein
LAFALSFILLSSYSFGRGLALLPEQAVIKITSHRNGDSVSSGELTIAGNSSDSSATDCQVFVDWNDLKPFQKAIATGPNGSNDFSSWKFTYNGIYHLINNGSNELTSKLSCTDKDSYLAKWYSINVTGLNQGLTANENASELLEDFQKENLTDKYQKTIFSSLKVNVPTTSEAKTLIKEKKVKTPDNYEKMKLVLLEYLKTYSAHEKNKLTPEQNEYLAVLPELVSQNPTPEQKVQLEALFPNIIKSLLVQSRDQNGGSSSQQSILDIAHYVLGDSKFNALLG